MLGQTTRKTLRRYLPVNPNLPVVEAQNLGEGVQLGEHGWPPLLHVGQKRGKNRRRGLVNASHRVSYRECLAWMDTNIMYSVKTGVEVPNYYSITASMLLPESLVGFLTAC